jgi:hypothetical protein
MLIKEIFAPTEAPPEAVATTQPATTVEPEPTQKDVQDIQALLGTIDPQKEQPQTLLNKLNGWMKQYPILDKVTDIIPQTRLIKAIAAAADAIEAGDSKTALNALAGAVGGGLATIAKGVNVGSALAQGDVKGAALAAGGNVAKAAKGAGAVASLAQGDVAGAVGTVNKTAGTAVNALQQRLASTVEDRELARIRELARV